MASLRFCNFLYAWTSRQYVRGVREEPLGRTDVTGNVVFAQLIDDQFQRARSALHVEIDGLHGCLILALGDLVVELEADGESIPLDVGLLQLKGHIPDTLRRALLRQLELKIVTVRLVGQGDQFVMGPGDRAREFSLGGTQGARQIGKILPGPSKIG